MMRHDTHGTAGPGRRRAGVALVLVAGSLASFLTLVALVVDVGYLFARQAHMQASVDVAVISALSSLVPDQPVPAQTDRLAVLCRSILSANGLSASTYKVQVLPGSGRSLVQLSVEGHEQMPAFFTRVMGRGSFDVAVASRGHSLSVPGRPPLPALIP